MSEVYLLTLLYTLYSRFTEIFVSELEDTADLKTLVVDYLQGLSPNAAIVDGIVRFVEHLTVLLLFSRFWCSHRGAGMAQW